MRLWRENPAPFATVAVVVLLSIMVCFWRRGPAGGSTLATARMSNVRADLADAGCIFTADVQLGSVWQQWAFARVRMDARREFVGILRNKRRYMVANAIEREALAVQMTDAVNRLARAEIAERVDFPRFELF